MGKISKTLQSIDNTLKRIENKLIQKRDFESIIDYLTNQIQEVLSELAEEYR